MNSSVRRLVAALGLAVPALAAGPAPVPVGEEPHHRVVFQNASTRVIDADLVPGYESLFHVHDRDNVPIVVGAGRVAVEAAGEAARERDLKLGEVWWAKAAYTHRLRNVGSTFVRFIDVEVLGPADAATPVASPPPAGHVLEIDNERVRVYRVGLAPGAARGPHTHGSDVLEVVVRPPAPEGRGAVPDGPGTFRWRAGGDFPAVANAGTAPAETIEIEWRKPAPRP